MLSFWKIKKESLFGAKILRVLGYFDLIFGAMAILSILLKMK